MGGEHTGQGTDAVSSKCTREPYVISLTNATPINLIKRTELTFCQGLFHQKKVPISKANRSRGSCKASACQAGICLETANYQHLYSAWKPFLQKTGSNFTPSQIVKQRLGSEGTAGRDLRQTDTSDKEQCEQPGVTRLSETDQVFTLRSKRTFSLPTKWGV